MASWMSLFTGRRDNKATAREAIVTLRQQLTMLEKKETLLQTRIEEEVRKARANATTNRAVATAALKRKKAFELELDRLSGQRLQLEMQTNTIESANLNAETMMAMKKGADALKAIHGNLNINKVDATMEQINAQREIANEISDAISNPVGALEIDESELEQELADLESEELNERLMGAERAPIHSPAGPSKVAASPIQEAEAEEEAELRQLQASLAMS